MPQAMKPISKEQVSALKDWHMRSIFAQEVYLETGLDCFQSSHAVQTLDPSCPFVHDEEHRRN